MSVDNGHTYGGKYGIVQNDYALWMIARGFGELVALTPEEMQRASVQPNCPRHREKVPMRWRGLQWVCYEHDEPVRVQIPPRLQDIPFYEGSAFDAIGKEVDVQYTKESWEARASWKYVERPL